MGWHAAVLACTWAATPGEAARGGGEGARVKLGAVTVTGAWAMVAAAVAWEETEMVA